MFLRGRKRPQDLLLRLMIDPLGGEIKSSGKFAILYPYKIGGMEGPRGTYGKIKVQDNIFFP